MRLYFAPEAKPCHSNLIIMRWNYQTWHHVCLYVAAIQICRTKLTSLVITADYALLGKELFVNLGATCTTNTIRRLDLEILKSQKEDWNADCRVIPTSFVPAFFSGRNLCTKLETHRCKPGYLQGSCSSATTPESDHWVTPFSGIQLRLRLITHFKLAQDPISGHAF